MTGRQIKISAFDNGSFDAYLALPAAGPAPGIIMLHEIFGVTGWIRKTADMFAEHGYCVAAPDMFWRLKPNFEGDFRSPEQTEQGRRYKALIDHDKAMDDIAAVAETLKSLPECNGRIGVTGFCAGGTLAYLAATRLKIDASAPYYGTQIHEFLGEARNIACPTVFHAGSRDDRVPADLPEKLQSAVKGMADVAVHIYEAGHAFANSERPDYHVEAATRLAHARTFDLFDTLR